MKLIAVSDLHGNLPEIPECDLLIIAGDICPDFIARAPQRAWFVDNFLPHLAKQPAKAALGTWGNHDWLPNPSREWADRADSHVIKVDELVEHEGLKIWFSPWSNQFGHWAWMAEPYRLADCYACIPEGVNIIVSHQPPFGYGDEPDPRYCLGEGPTHVGSHELLATIQRVQPDMVICGHIHGGHGSYKIGRTTVYNVSLVNEAYQPVNGVTEIEL